MKPELAKPLPRGILGLQGEGGGGGGGGERERMPSHLQMQP